MTSNASLVRRLLLVCVAMFGFGFAMVPLYDVFCRITGINGKTEGVAAAQPAGVDLSREVSVEFLARSDADMPWTFVPLTERVRIHPGDLQIVEFEVANRSGEALVATAVPSVSPGEAARYFKKIECFCFEEQALAAGETRSMPVQFYIDPALPERFRNMTLSYRLYRSAHTASR